MSVNQSLPLDSGHSNRQINGLDLLEAIHASSPGLPVIFVTGHPEMLEGLAPDVPRHFMVFTKPFNGQELLEAIRDAVQ
jgi:DNA-binding NtrC family response regulator